MSESRYSDGHLTALRRFALSITILTVLGHAFLGFEQSYLQPLVALATAYGMQLFLETMEALIQKRTPRFHGGLTDLVNFLLSAHISALAISMLLYYNDRLWVVAFATSVAIGSKYLFRVPVGGGTKHFLNPSNFGITVTLVAFPSVGLGFPWQFLEGTRGLADWILPITIFVLGGLLNLKCTKRIPLIAGWLIGFVTQATLRSLLTGSSLLAALAPATGVSAMLFTFYMVSDPSTTPKRPRDQFLFGFSVALVYMAFVMAHIADGLFYALTVVCFARGFWLLIQWFAEGGPVKAATSAQEPAALSASPV